MITLFCNYVNLLESTTPEIVTAWVTLALDIIAAIMLIYKAIKSKHITLKDILNFFRKPENVRNISTEIEKVIKGLENETEETENKDKNKDKNDVY